MQCLASPADELRIGTAENEQLSVTSQPTPAESQRWGRRQAAEARLISTILSRTDSNVRIALKRSPPFENGRIKRPADFDVLAHTSPPAITEFFGGAAVIAVDISGVI